MPNDEEILKKKSIINAAYKQTIFTLDSLKDFVQNLLISNINTFQEYGKITTSRQKVI